MSKEQIKIRIAGDKDCLQWDQFVDRSSMGSIFHKMAWLKAAADETRTELVSLLGYRGQKIAFALPIFIKKIIGLRFAFSPPPRCLIPDMGLVLPTENIKQDAFEKKYFSTVDDIDRFIQQELKVDFIRLVNSVELTDMRPFKWKSYKITPNYTYFLTLQNDEKTLNRNMKSKVRQNIRRALKYSDLKIFTGDRNSYFELIELVRNRYTKQNMRLPVSNTYMWQIYDNFAANQQVSIKAIRNDKHLLSGLILLKYKNKIQYWIGGVLPQENYIGINELLHWSAIKENLNGNISYYDFVGANTPHLCRFKSKFNPTLKVYFQVEKGNFQGNFLKFLYEKLIKRNSSDRI